MSLTAAIVAAGGRGVRVGAGRPKQFLELDGRSILEMSVGALAASDRVDEIVVALPEEHLAEVAKAWPSSAKPLAFVAGGARRQDSVANAFAKSSRDADVILIHDAARPFVTSGLIARTVDAARAHGAAIAAIPVRDTVKQAGDPDRDGSRPIRATIPRHTVFLAQTPQAFRRDVLARALEEGKSIDATDEAMLVERLGLPVHVVEGDPRNVKITTAEDLATAKAVALQTSPERLEGDGFSRRLIRIGNGYDLHKLVAGRPLILAGVTIPFELGLEGHSDADLVCHAVTDAVLGAAGVGDIGRLFPDTDPKWKGADSIQLLKGAMAIVRAAGYSVSNVDAVIIAERPKLAPHVPAMRANLAQALGIETSAVSVKGKTNEKVDALGRNEAIAVHAVVLLGPGR
jgi:2-C-methyl-D-erythritol 4-phosphate cytidylyltransferase / 2-C-methyl-D-erythritol 2,4-cyclodiphosphate synthase